MAYAFVTPNGFSNNGNASGSALTVTKPTGCVDGHLIIVVAYLESDTNTWSSVGSGFSEFVAARIVNTGAFSVTVWWKIAASEPTSWTWTPTTGSVWRSISVACYSGALGTGIARTDVAGGSQADGVGLGAQTAPSVTPTVTGDLLVFAYGNFGGVNVTATTGACTNTRVSTGGTTISDNPAATTSATGTTAPSSGPGSETYAASHSTYKLDTGGAAATIPPPFAARQYFQR